MQFNINGMECRNTVWFDIWSNQTTIDNNEKHK
jgi:hypothetical protein